VLGACTARLARVDIARATEIGAGVAIAPASLTLEDATIRDTRPDAMGELGRAVNVQMDGRAELHRVVVEHNHETSIEVREGATLEDAKALAEVTVPIPA